MLSNKDGLVGELQRGEQCLNRSQQDNWVLLGELEGTVATDAISCFMAVTSQKSRYFVAGNKPML